VKRPARILSVIAAAVLLIAGSMLAIAAALERGHFRGSLQRVISSRVQRPVRIEGELDLHLITFRPRAVARGVHIDNPEWMPPGEFAAIDELHVVFAPTLRHPLKVEAVELHGAKLRPARDREGRSNWRLREKSRPPRQGGGLLPLHRLVLRDVAVWLKDERRHLDYEGSLVTVGDDTAAPLRFEAEGQLNGRPVSAWLEGDPLIGAKRDSPFAWRFEVRSSGSRLSGSGTVNTPFDLLDIDLDFRAEGADLRDLYYLAGMRLPDTGKYTATGHLARRGPRLELRDLDLRSGESDLAGSYVSESKDGRSRFTAELTSKRLRTADVGARAAGRERPPEGPPRLFRATSLPLAALRGRDGSLQFRAGLLELGPLRLQEVATQFELSGGRLRSERLSAGKGGGSLSGKVSFDARDERPEASLELTAKALEFESLLPTRAKTAPLAGPLDGTVSLTATGRSPRELAAGAKGEVALRIGAGAMRASLAELLGVDLRGIGLALSGADSKVELRCAGVRFEIGEGSARARVLVIDTAPVVLHGEGSIDLQSEAIDLRFRGQPKQPRLRLRAPLVIGGTLASPSPRLEPGRSIVQGGAALALGALVTPVAAAAAFVDPGRGRDVDCSRVAEESRADR
jgi:AsmA family protein